MILNPEWLKPKEKPYFHQILLVYIGKLIECVGRVDKGEIDADTCLEIGKQILVDEFDDPEFLEFAIDNFSEIFWYIAKGQLNIRIHRDMTGLPARKQTVS